MPHYCYCRHQDAERRLPESQALQNITFMRVQGCMCIGHGHGSTWVLSACVQMPDSTVRGVDSITNCEVTEQTAELMKPLAAALPCSKDHGNGIILAGGQIRA